MAIKGKSRRRGRARGVHAPPKPLIQPRKLTLTQRPEIRKGLVVVLGLAVVLGGLRVWQNSSRTDSLASYFRALKKAEAPYLAHVSPGSATAIDEKIGGFGQGQISPADFRAFADQWEKDFDQAKKNVEALRPPRPVKDAQDWIVEALDGFRGVARLLNVAAQQREFADKPAQKAIQQSLENQVQVIIQHANEWLTRVRALFQRGVALFEDYRRSWHVTETVTSGSGGAPAIPGQ